MDEVKAARIAFLDRDGVLNLDSEYLVRPEECQWVEGASTAVRRLNAAGYLVVVATNQSGIARGYYSLAQFESFTNWFEKTLADQGAIISRTYFCPHHPSVGSPCECRKPRPGMLNRAIEDFGADKSRCFLIGDRPSDLEAAAAAGLPGYLFCSGNLDSFVEDVLCQLPCR